jgi:RNA polymerase sigma factor (sigma-70 family)
MVHDEGWPSLVDAIRRGDSQALREFYVEYGPLLHRLAARHVGGGLRRRVEPDDVVQSVCRTFLRRARNGQFEINDSDGLWGLLCAITLNKVRKLLRFHLRHKRDVKKEAVAAAADDSSHFLPLLSPEPTPAEAAEFDDELRRLLHSLDDEQRQVVMLKLQQYTNKEVAKQLGSSERTVRRIMKVVQAHLTRQLEVVNDDR